MNTGKLFKFIILLLIGTIDIRAENQEHLNLQRKSRFRTDHVGPPPRDAAFHGSLNASVQSETQAAQRVRKSCETLVQSQLEAGVNSLLRQIHYHDLNHQGTASLRRKIALLGMCSAKHHYSISTDQEMGDYSHQKNLQEPIEDSKFRLLMGLSFAFHKRAMRSRDAVYFLHISKAGGTSFCANSYENECRDPNYGEGSSPTSWRWNCWSKKLFNGPKWVIMPSSSSKSDIRKAWWGIPEKQELVNHNVSSNSTSAHPTTSDHGSNAQEGEGEATHVFPVLSTTTWSPSLVRSHDPNNPTCRDHRDEVVNNKITFLMNENWLPEFGRLCDTFLNMVIFRNPIQRIMSHRLYLKGLQSKLQDPIPLDMKSFYEKAYVISDNYYIRVLCGEDVYRLHAGNITSAHLRHALNVIKEFDLVLILEHIKLHSPILLSRGLGWLNNKVANLNQKPKKTESIETSMADIKFITSMNEKDMVLYDKAAELAELDFEFFRQVELIGDEQLQVFEKELLHVRKQDEQLNAVNHAGDCEYTCGYACLGKQ